MKISTPKDSVNNSPQHSQVHCKLHLLIVLVYILHLSFFHPFLLKRNICECEDRRYRRMKVNWNYLWDINLSYQIYCSFAHRQNIENVLHSMLHDCEIQGQVSTAHYRLSIVLSMSILRLYIRKVKVENFIL